MFNTGRLGTGTNTTWTFKTATDDAVATLLVSSEGTTVGATPNGFAQVHINAQDEVPMPGGPPMYRDGDARGLFERQQALASSLDQGERQLVELYNRIEVLTRRINELEHK